VRGRKRERVRSRVCECMCVCIHACIHRHLEARVHANVPHAIAIGVSYVPVCSRWLIVACAPASRTRPSAQPHAHTNAHSGTTRTRRYDGDAGVLPHTVGQTIYIMFLSSRDSDSAESDDDDDDDDDVTRTIERWERRATSNDPR